MSYTRATGPRGAGRSTDWTRSVQRPPPDVGPLAVLVDGRTASGAELLAAALQEHLGAQLVGSSTCGCVLGIRQYQPLPGGAELAVSEIGFYSAHGRRIEGSGLDPDVVAEPTLEDLRQGLDPALTAAERLLGATSAGLRAAAPPLPATSPTMETPR
jgi:carboxyl-terminal processing protease